MKGVKKDGILRTAVGGVRVERKEKEKASPGHLKGVIRKDMNVLFGESRLGWRACW
jgi:hypothetical protein